MFKNSVLCSKIISAFAVFCTLAHCGTAFAAERDSLRDCGARIAVAADFPLLRGDAESATVREYKSKGAGGKTSHVLFAMHFNSDPSAWEEMKFSFVPSESMSSNCTAWRFEPEVGAEYSAPPPRSTSISFCS